MRRESAVFPPAAFMRLARKVIRPAVVRLVRSEGRFS
jgi:hypothetical protein